MILTSLNSDLTLPYHFVQSYVLNALCLRQAVRTSLALFLSSGIFHEDLFLWYPLFL